MAKSTKKQPQGKATTQDVVRIPQEVMDRLVKYAGSAYHQETDTLDRSYVHQRLQSVHGELSGLYYASKTMGKYSGRTYTSPEEKGKQKVLVFIGNRLNSLSYLLTGEPAKKKKEEGES